MSTLPTAPKDISTHPAKGSVTSPVQRDEKDRDVERKIKMYGVIDALRHYKLPSNAQLDHFLASLINRSPSNSNNTQSATSARTTSAPGNTTSTGAAIIPTQQTSSSDSTIASLSPGGKQLTQDVKSVVETLRLIINSKNSDERIQELVWRMRDLPADNLKNRINNASEDVGPGKDKVVNDHENAMKHMRTLFSLLLTNAEARKLLTDFSTLGRDLLARGAIHAAEMIKPDQERLEGVDESAPADHFITRDTSSSSSSSSSDFLSDHEGDGLRDELGARIRGGDIGGAKDATKDTAKGRAQDTANVALGQTLSQTTDTQGTKNDNVQTQAGETVGQLKDDVRKEQSELVEAQREGDDDKVEEKKKGLKERAKRLRDNVKSSLSDAVPDKHKGLARDKAERGKKFLNEEYLPKDRRDQFIFRGKKVIMECQKHDDYQGSIRWLLSFIEEYAAHGRNAAGTGKEHVGGLTDDPVLSQTFDDIRVLLERFANGKNLGMIKDAIDAMVDDARRDEALKGWWKNVDTYVRKVLLEPGYVLEPDCNNQAKSLRDSGRQFFDDKYKDHFNNLFNTIAEWAKGWREDPVNKQFANNWAALAKDLLFDAEGNLKFKPELWNDVRSVLLPTFIEKVGYIPIPRIEYTDDGLDLVVENLTLEGRNLFPNIVAIESHNFLKFSPYTSISRTVRGKDEEKHHVRITMEQIQADMRDVRFVYRKKTGVMKMRDEGVADVLLGGSGLTITIDLATSPTSSFLSSPKVNVSIDTLKFAIRDSNHDFLYKTLKPLATKLIKRQLKKAIEEAVILGVGVFGEGIDRVMESVQGIKVFGKKQADAVQQGQRPASPSAAADHVPSPTPKGPATARVSSIASTESKKNAQFKIVADPNDSLLSHEGHNEGWAKKLGETKAVARETAGEKEGWRSAAFSLN